MFTSLEYLYWYDTNGELRHRIDNYRGMIHACMMSKAHYHWCYAPHYQFTSPWIGYDDKAGVTHIIKESEVPTDIRALHLLLYRGI